MPRRVVNFLPDFYQTDTNQKFLNATLDQLISEPVLRNINGFIGRKDAPTAQEGDNYIIEPTTDRQNYQLEPAVITKNAITGRVESVGTYADLLNRIKYHGGLNSNNDVLFNNEHYSFGELIDTDKLVNFSHYFWVPEGPDVIDIFTTDIDTTKTYVVTREELTNSYALSGEDGRNPSIVLARGGTYIFDLAQDGFDFWIQTEQGISGVMETSPNISTRNVLGITNNGASSGQLIFNVPPVDAQDDFVTMNKVADVNLATTLPFKDLHNQVLDVILDTYDGIDGLQNLSNKTICFVGEFGDGDWTTQSLFDDSTEPFDSVGFAYESIVPEAQRTGYFRIAIEDNAGTDIVKLTYDSAIPQNEKVGILEGTVNSNREVWHSTTGFLDFIPLITANRDILYYRDSVDPLMIGVIRLVNIGAPVIIDVERDILGHTTYITPNGVIFKNGMKIAFDENVISEKYQNKQWYIEGVGKGITLTAVEDLVIFDEDPQDPDYRTIRRDSIDGNPWSRENRWFHYETLRQTSVYNNTPFDLDYSGRAIRPIIEFLPNLKLYNFGYNRKQIVDMIDFGRTDVLSNLEGQVGGYIDGVLIEQDMYLVFAGDADADVREKIWQAKFINPQNDSSLQLHFEEADTVVMDDVIIVSKGVESTGLSYYLSDGEWIAGQTKLDTSLDPLFDIFDENDLSYGDQTQYQLSTFAGSKLFNYKIGTGTDDPILGFPLSYRSIQNFGDIVFDNYFENDTFNYILGVDTIVKNINDGHVREFSSATSWVFKNMWTKVIEDSVQFHKFSYISKGEIDFLIYAEPVDRTLQSIKVWCNNILQTDENYEVLFVSNNWHVRFFASTKPGSKIDIRVYAANAIPQSFYEIPLNLDNNTCNEEFADATLGQMRNHLTTTSANIKDFDGVTPGINNLHDLYYQVAGGNILQHTGPMFLPMFLLTDNVNDFVEATLYNQKSYALFKDVFLDRAEKLSQIGELTVPEAVDAILTEINEIKNSNFAFFYTDMVPFGDIKETNNWIVVNPDDKEYEFTTFFDDTIASNKAVLVYQNGVQLYKGSDYTFSTTRPAVIISDDVTLSLNDTIDVIEYSDTDGSFVPATPTKLGIYPKYKPELYLDNTYSTGSRNVIQGHDGSIFVAFNDFRDGLLIELETRIYNNIKVDYDEQRFNWADVNPGKFRGTDFSHTGTNRILSQNFLNWAGTNRVDYTEQFGFNVGEPFTYNYSDFGDRIDGELMIGAWRGIYRYFYDTDRPHTHPWEMLGITEKPTWWNDYYGPAPYTAGNLVLWNDLRDGILHADATGTNFTVKEEYIRPELLDVLPVDDSGRLLDPLTSIVKNFNSTFVEKSYVFGDEGPIESAWRRSSNYPFALQILAALTKPAKYFGLHVDMDRYVYNSSFDQWLMTTTNKRFTKSDIRISGEVDAAGNIERTHSYLNWVADHITNLGYDRTTQLGDRLRGIELNLTYKAASYTDKNYLKVVAEHSSPDTTNSNLFVPDEDFQVSLYKTRFIDRIVLSGVIIEKTGRGFKIDGYDRARPYFTILPSVETANNYVLEVGSERGIVYEDFSKNTIDVAYGTEFVTTQEVFDFFTSYGRYLESFGFVFDDVIGDQSGSTVKNWQLAGKEFLFWAQQGWEDGSVIAITPFGSELKLVRIDNTIIDEITNTTRGSRIMGVNFSILKNDNYIIKRIDNTFEIKTVDDQAIGLLDINTAQFEHVLIFNNTTVFNDIIYDPATGNRQGRLKLIGYKTDWNGNLSPSGFIYNEDNIPEWKANVDYKKGTLITFKNRYFYAVEDLVAVTQFNFNKWQEIEKDQLNLGLLQNFANTSSNFLNYYNTDIVNLESETDIFGKGLIGYRNREYLRRLGLEDVSQVKFYQGFIKEKGTANALNKLFRAQLDILQGSISLFEEWAIKTGSYGGTDVREVLEVELPEQNLTSNPSVIQFIDNTSEYPINAQGYKISDIWAVPDSYTSDLFALRSNKSENPAISENQFYKENFQYCGYPTLDEIKGTIFDLNDIASLNTSIDEIGIGYTIWTAKNFQNDWDVYRVSEVEAKVIQATDNQDETILLITDNQHNLAKDDVILMKNFLSEVDGFYKVLQVPDTKQLVIAFNAPQLDFEGNGLLLKLESVRFRDINDFAEFQPLFGWRERETVWLDTNENSKWEVLNKEKVWNFNQYADPLAAVAGGEIGTMVTSSLDDFFVYAGSPEEGVTGKCYSFFRDLSVDEWPELFTFNGANSNARKFGTAIASKDRILAIGAPESNLSKGFVSIYEKDLGTIYRHLQQIAASDAVINDLFGSEITMSDDERWLFIGAPAANKVYVYYKEDLIDVANEDVEGFVADGSSTIYTVAVTPGSIENLRITDDSGNTLIPYVDYTLSGNNITFSTAPVVNFTVRQGYAFIYYTTLTGSVADSSVAIGDFGTTISSNTDGTRIIVGGPNSNDGVATNTGSAWIFDRSVEAFSALNEQVVFTTIDTIKDTVKVAINGEVQILTTDYTVTDTNEITFVFASRPNQGDIVEIDTNEFREIERLFAPEPQTSSSFALSSAFCNTDCSFYIGAPNFDNASIVDSGKVYRYGNQSRLYGTITGTIAAPTVTIGHSIRVNNFIVTFTGTSLDDVVDDINNATISGITASKSAADQLVIISDSTIENKILQLAPGTGTGLADLGIDIYVKLQEFTQPTDETNNRSHFGYDISVHHNETLVISSRQGTAFKETVFDEEVDADNNIIFDTYFDARSTIFIDKEERSGSVYVYEFKAVATPTVSDPGRFIFADELVSDTITSNDKFGWSIHLNDTFIYVGAPTDEINNATDSGRVYIFDNPSRIKTWNQEREENPLVDISLINNLFTFGKLSREKINEYEIIDPFKGKIAGTAEQEIAFKTNYDPAQYNISTSTTATLNERNPWDGEQVGYVWWNLDDCRFIWYEQGSAEYRRTNWARLFPGSSVEIYEWVESNVLPSEYVDNNSSGEAVYPDNSVYVITTAIDSITGIEINTYYYWVKNRTDIPPVGFRDLSIFEVANRIENPKTQGLHYVGIPDTDTVLLYNITDELNANNTIFHIDYDAQETEQLIHSEYDLIRDGDPISNVNDVIYTKLKDSLSGINNAGNVVPDPSLSVSRRYGLDVRPRQTMFIDRLAALKSFIEYSNNVFSQFQILENRNITLLSSEDPIPESNSGEYDIIVPDLESRDFISTITNPIGYRVLVRNDSSEDNLWVIYEIDDLRNWAIYRVQAYNTSLYWDEKDWYEDGYSTFTEPTIVVETLNDLQKLSDLTTNDIIRVNNNGNGQWALMIFDFDGDRFANIALQNATLEIDEDVYNYDNFGFDVKSFDSQRFDQESRLESSFIIDAIATEIFVNDLSIYWNQLLVLMFNFTLSEQRNIDWLFKSSFISILHQISELAQPSGYKLSNQTFVEDYIKEAKPYRTNIREYVIDYFKTDPWDGSVTDFDLPAYYDTDLNRFRSPNGEQTKDRDLYDLPQYIDWRDNHEYFVDQIIVTAGGSGYIEAPQVIVGESDIKTPITQTTSFKELVNVETDYDSLYTYVSSNGIPEHSFGPFPNDNDPNPVIEQEYVFKFTRSPVEASIKQTLPLGAIGVAINGVPIYSPSSDSIVVINGATFTENAVTARTHLGTDDGSGHPQEDGAYHYHSDPTKVYGKIVGQHSPIIGWAFDGHPIYGCYSYANNNQTGGIVIQTPSYRLKSGNRDDGSLYDGTYLEDFEYVPGLGMLDRYNGRTTVTPEYPAGVYAYFVTVDPNDVTVPIYPYIIGPQYHGIPLIPNGNDLLPSITVVGRTDVVATANIASGAVVSIDITTKGGGFTGAPSVTIIGGSGSGATAVAYIKNNTIRKIIPTVKFDRVSYTSDVVDWTVDTAYTAGQIVSYNSEAYQVTNDFTSGSTFVGTNFTVVLDESFDNANDRTMAYYTPQSGQYGKDLTQIFDGIEYPGVTYDGHNFDGPGFDSTPFDQYPFDPVELGDVGQPQLSARYLDTILEGSYFTLDGSTITTIGTAPEDINVDGGEFVDTYSSHAPQELVPGRVFDTLDFQVYQDNDLTGAPGAYIGWRIFQDVLGNVNYYRISEQDETTLAADLNLSDTTITVVDGSVLATPQITQGNPGVVMIGGERITYWNKAGNVLSGILRGTAGTRIVTTHTSGAYVTDMSSDQIMPVDAHNQVWYDQGIGTATNGLGLLAATTDQANFLKLKSARLPT